MSTELFIDSHIIEELLKKWNIEHIDSIEPTLEGGGRTWFIKTMSAGDFVLKESSRIKSGREYKYLLALSKTEIPVAVPVTTIEGEWYVDNDNAKIYRLYPKLPGHIITEHYIGDAPKRAKGYGQAIGLLHTCLLEIDDVSGCQEMDLVAQVQKWAIPVIEKERTIVNACAIEQIWKDVRPGLISLCKNVPLQLIHRDAHPSNMLFDAGELTGFLDFEMVTRGLPLFDVCYCGSSILVGGFEDPEKEKKWPTLLQFIVKGYEEHCPLTSSERDSVYEVLVAIELIFIAFWLDNHDAGRARKNEKILCWLGKHKDALNI